MKSAHTAPAPNLIRQFAAHLWNTLATMSWMLSSVSPDRISTALHASARGSKQMGMQHCKHSTLHRDLAVQNTRSMMCLGKDVTFCRPACYGACLALPKRSPVARGKPGARMHDSHRILMALLRTLVPGSVEA